MSQVGNLLSVIKVPMNPSSSSSLASHERESGESKKGSRESKGGPKGNSGENNPYGDHSCLTKGK